MNNQRHRIVFNTTRGQWMAVAETATARGKGGTAPASTPKPCPGPTWALHLLSTALLCAGLYIHAPAEAQIIANTNAPVGQRPTVLLDNAGRPLVNIQTPSAAGVSRNSYKQFDVQSNGIVLNNDRSSKPWLATGAAKVILNEVSSSNPTYLRGAVAVQGQRAQVVVANPSGIQVDGASFANASRVTLTTGTAVVSSGALTGFDVRQGSVDILENGLNVKGIPYTDILSRAATLGGRVDGAPSGTLAITTGPQVVDYTTGQLTTQAGTGTKPTVAIDTAALGGMYAGSITLLATESGVGVRNAGTLQGNTANGQLIITADGKLQNTGRIDAAVTNVATVNGNIDNAGTLLGRDVLLVSAGGNVTLSGTGSTQSSARPSTVMVSSKGDISLASGARIGSDGQATAADGTVRRGSVTLSAGNALRLSSGSVLANGAVNLSANGQITAASTTVRSTASDVTALSAQGITLTNASMTGDAVHLETGAPFQDTAAHISISGGKVSGTRYTAALATGNLSINSPDTAAVQSTGNVRLEAGGNLTITAGTQVTAGSNFNAWAGNTLQLQGTSGTTATTGKVATITAQGEATFSGNALTFTGSRVNAGGELALEARQGNLLLNALPNAAGAAHDRVQLTAGGDVNASAHAGDFAAKSIAISGNNVNIVSNGTTSIGNVTNVSGGTSTVLPSTITAKGDLTIGSIHATKAVDIRNSQLNATGDITVHANANQTMLAVTATTGGSGTFTSATGYINSTGGIVRAADSLTFASKGAQVHNAANYTGGAVTVFSQTGSLGFGNVALHAAGTPNTALAASSGQLSVEAGGAISAISNTTFKAATDLAIVAGAGNIVISSIGAAPVSSTEVTTPTLTLLPNQLSAGRDLELSARNGLLRLAGQSGTAGNPSAKIIALSSKRDLKLSGAMVELQASKLSSTRDTTITSHVGDILIDGVKNAFTAYSPKDRVAALQQEINSYNSKIAAFDADPAYAQLKFNHATTWQELQRVILEDMYTTPGVSGYQIQLMNQYQALDAALKPYENVRAPLVQERSQLEQVRATLAGAAKGAENLGASIKGRNVNITSAGGLAVYGAEINATGTAKLNSAGVLPGDSTAATAELQKPIGTILAGLSDFYEYGTAGSSSHAFALMSRPTVISGKAGVTIQTTGTTTNARLILNDAAVQSSSGKVHLQSLGDMRLESGQEEFYRRTTNTYTKRSWFGLKKKTITETRTSQNVEASPVVLQGKNIELKSGGSISAYASEFLAPAGNIQITAANALNLYAIPEISYSQFDVSKRSSFLGVTYSKGKSTTTREVSAQLPAKLVAQSASTASGWNTLLQGTVFKTSLTGANISAGVGANASADAKIILQGIRTTVTQSHTKEANYVVWQRMQGSGSTTQTLTLPSFSGPATPVFKGPVLASIPAGDFKSQVQTLAAQPGMAYVAELAQRSDVNWQPVKLAFDQWQYKQEGLTPAGAALVAVAVAWATGGMGADLTGGTVVVDGVTTTTLTGHMANAAFTALASQAAITFINNKGNIGKTLKDLASSDVVRATIAAALTAGVLEKIGGTSTMTDLAKKTGFSDKLTLNLINSSGRALVGTAINGGNLEDALKTALLGGLVDTVHGQVASQIATLQSDYLVHKLAHALAGCVAGAAANGSCRDGAIGGAVGEMVADLFQGQVPAWDAPQAEWDAFDAKVKAYGKLVAGAVAAYAGGNAQTAITTAEVAIDNNSRLSFRIQAMQQQVSQQQFWLNTRVQSLRNAITELGGSVPSNMTASGARVNYTQNDMVQMETLLRSLSPQHQLIYSQPSSTVSPMPASYVNMRYSVNMQNVGSGSSVNAFGFNRDSTAFFRELLRTNPELFSAQNQRLINNREAPIVDAQWIQFNPTHQSFSGTKLIHHHWMQGNIAVPIPESVHIQWNNSFHPYR